MLSSASSLQMLENYRLSFDGSVVVSSSVVGGGGSYRTRTRDRHSQFLWTASQPAPPPLASQWLRRRSPLRCSAGLPFLASGPTCGVRRARYSAASFTDSALKPAGASQRVTFRARVFPCSGTQPLSAGSSSVSSLWREQFMLAAARHLSSLPYLRQERPRPLSEAGGGAFPLRE